MSILVYVNRHPYWSLFQRAHRGWQHALPPLPIVDPKLSLHYRPFMRKSKPRGRRPMWNVREPGRFGKLPRRLYSLPIVDPKLSLHYRPFMRKSKPRGRRPMWQITDLGAKRWKRSNRDLPLPIVNPKLSLHYKPFMRKSKPKRRKPMWELTIQGTKRWKFFNRNYPLPYRQPFRPYITPAGPAKWRNSEPKLTKLRKDNPKLED